MPESVVFKAAVQDMAGGKGDVLRSPTDGLPYDVILVEGAEVIGGRCGLRLQR